MVLGGRDGGLGGGGGSGLGGGLEEEPSGAYLRTEYVCRIYVVDNYEVSLWKERRVMLGPLFWDLCRIVLAVEGHKIHLLSTL